MRQKITPARVRFIGLIFVLVVVVVFAYTHQLIIPIFLGLLTWGKAWFKSLTPKLGIYLIKNGLVIQLRQLLVKASTHVLVKSHRPWRRRASWLKATAVHKVKSIFAAYLLMPLWARCAIAIALLLTTAGSSFAIFALLIVPQPVLNWLRSRVMSTLNKLGVTKAFAAMYKFALPESLRNRWHMHLKWTIGRRQVRTANALAKTISSNQSETEVAVLPTNSSSRNDIDKG